MSSLSDRLPEFAQDWTQTSFDRGALHMDETRDASLWKGAVAGAIAGAAGAYVMEKFQTKALPKLKEWSGLKEESASSSGDEQQKSEPATTKAAAGVAEKVFDAELSDAQKKPAGEAAHYAMGITSGIIYGVAAERMSRATAGHGMAFGTAVWGVADEVVVPALGLSSPPWEHPPKTHAYALASHLVYGLTVETVRRTVRKAL